LPALDSILLRLSPLIQWIDRPLAVIPETRLVAVPVGVGEVAVAPAGIRYWGGGLPLEAIRFAGSNRLLIEFDYHGTHRFAEPYSLREASTGNLLFYGWEHASYHIKAFKVSEMFNVKATTQSFQPRYRVEFTPHGAVPVLPANTPIRHSYAAPRRSPAKQTTGHALTYVFECPYCGKRFRHTKNDAELRKHKSKDGYWDCNGRRGYLVDTQS
jgi:hypothetical protein